MNGRTVSILVASVFVFLIAGEAPAHAAREVALQEAIAVALESSPDLATAVHRVSAARAGVRQAQSVFYPRLRVSESYAATNSPVQAFTMTLNQRAFDFGANFNNPATTDNLSTQILASYSLYNGGSDLAQRDAARLQVEARERSLDAVRNELIFEVKRAFHTVVKARRFVAAAEASVASMEASLELARRRHEQGAALKTDVLDAEVRLAQAREDRVRARSILAQSETLFRQVLGVGEDSDITAVDVDTRLDRRDVARANGAAVSALQERVVDVRERAEWRAARKAVEAAERKVRAARGGHLPRVNAFAGYQLDSGDASRFADSWLAGVTLEVDVFDGFRTRGHVAEAVAELNAARSALRRTELALQAEVQRARVIVDEADARLATTEQTVAQARESLGIVKDRYGSGLALLAQVLDAETALTAARQRRIAAEADYRIALAALDKAFGRDGVVEP